MSQEMQEQAPIPEQVADTSVAAEPVETPEVPQADASDTSETVAESDEQKAEKLIQQRKVREDRERRKLNQRFSEITGQRDAYKMALDILRERQQAPTPAQVQQDGEPKESDFDDYAKYQREVAKWEARQVVKAETARARQEWEREVQARGMQSQVVQTLGDFEQRREAYAKANPDYDSAAEALESIPIGPHNAAMVEAILHHPDSPKVLQHLGNHLGEAARISRLSPVLQAAAIGELAASLRSVSPPQVSNAPAPGKPVAARAGSSTEPPSDPNKYMEWAEKHMR